MKIESVTEAINLLRKFGMSLNKRQAAICESRAKMIESGGVELKRIREWIDDAERWQMEQ